eukprot:359139-Chlamydomonas_euryale.AAC.6
MRAHVSRWSPAGRRPQGRPAIRAGGVGQTVPRTRLACASVQACEHGKAGYRAEPSIVPRGVFGMSQLEWELVKGREVVLPHVGLGGVIGLRKGVGEGQQWRGTGDGGKGGAMLASVATTAGRGGRRCVGCCIGVRHDSALMAEYPTLCVVEVVGVWHGGTLLHACMHAYMHVRPRAHPHAPCGGCHKGEAM